LPHHQNLATVRRVGSSKSKAQLTAISFATPNGIGATNFATTNFAIPRQCRRLRSQSHET
jgi:hypothetical protein